MGNASKPSTQINRLLRAARLDAGKSLEDAANHLGITAASMSRMETGASGVMADRVAVLANFYGVSVAELLDGRLVSQPNSIDLDRMKAVIEFVQEKIVDTNSNPTPAKIALTVIQVYERELERGYSNSLADIDFDADYHAEFVMTMLME